MDVRFLGVISVSICSININMLSKYGVCQVLIIVKLMFPEENLNMRLNQMGNVDEC